MFKKRVCILAFFSLVFSIIASAQDFRLVDYSKGYYNPHQPDKMVKLSLMKKVMPLTIEDFNGDGKPDTILYKLSMHGGQIATIVVYDPKEDDWITLYKMDLNGYGGYDGVWFYQVNIPGSTPMLIIYTGRSDYRMVTVAKYDSVQKKYVTKDYKVFNKNLFPHRFVINKKKILNQNGSNQDTFEEIPVDGM